MKILLMLVMLGAAPALAEPRQTTGGRFQLIQLSDQRRDQFLIDSETGEVWGHACVRPKDGAPEAEGDCYWFRESVEGKAAPARKRQKE